MKLNIKESFKKRSFRYGGYSILLSCVVIAALIAVNILASKTNFKADMTKNKLYSLSDQTYKVLDALKDNVDIYVFAESGKEDPTISAIINKYKLRSKKINIEYKDPVKYPEFAKQFAKDGTEVGNGSIVVKSGSKFKLISSNELVNYNYDASGQPSSADSLAVEQMVTGGIINVTSKETQTIQNLTGHQESELAEQVTKQLESENYTVKSANLILKDAKLDTNSALLVLSPQRDLSKDEAGILKDFLSKGGRAVFLMDVTKNDLPNFQSILNDYGVGIKKSVIVEGDSSYSTQNPVYIVPSMEYHDILSVIKSNNTPIVLPVAQVIENKSSKSGTVTVEPLLTTSKNSWGKLNLQATTLNKESGDLTGPFNVAVAITDKAKSTDAKDTKLVVVSNGAFASSQFVGNGANLDFLMNSIDWLQDKKDSISIRPKSLSEGNITMNGMQQLSLAGVVVIVIPAAIAIWGTVVLKKRRQA